MTITAAPHAQVVIAPMPPRQTSETVLREKGARGGSLRRDTSNFLRPRANGSEGDMLELMMLGVN